jgi:hypothetical protein
MMGAEGLRCYSSECRLDAGDNNNNAEGTAMTVLARACLALGLAAVTAGIMIVLVPFGDALLATRPVFRAPIQPGESAYSRWISVEDPVVRVGVELTITPRLAAEDMRASGADRYVGLYRLPLHYRVRDDAGRLLIDQWVLLDATRDRTLRQEQIDHPNPVPLRVNSVFDAVQVEPGARVRVEAVLLPDRLYSADVDLAELRLFREPPPLTGPVRGALQGLFAGIGLILLGAMLELLALRLRMGGAMARQRVRLRPVYPA